MLSQQMVWRGAKSMTAYCHQGVRRYSLTELRVSRVRSTGNASQSNTWRHPALLLDLVVDLHLLLQQVVEQDNLVLQL